VITVSAVVTPSFSLPVADIAGSAFAASGSGHFILLIKQAGVWLMNHLPALISTGKVKMDETTQAMAPHPLMSSPAWLGKLYH
jgi:hypothetical protein